MNSQVMTPCISGKCGVKSHILGSAEQKACGVAGAVKQSGGINSTATVSQPMSPQATAHKLYRDELEDQKEAFERSTLTTQGEPTGNKIKDLVFRLRTNQEERNNIGSEMYRSGGHSEKVQKAFIGALRTAANARPSIEGGESVAPLKLAGSDKSFSDIKYVKDRGGIQINATEQDGTLTTVKYGEFQIDYLNESHTRHKDLEHRRSFTRHDASFEGRSGRNDHEYCSNMMELLAHCQNEKNWSA